MHEQMLAHARAVRGESRGAQREHVAEKVEVAGRRLVHAPDVLVALALHGEVRAAGGGRDNRAMIPHDGERVQRR